MCNTFVWYVWKWGKRAYCGLSYCMISHVLLDALNNCSTVHIKLEEGGTRVLWPLSLLIIPFSIYEVLFAWSVLKWLKGDIVGLFFNVMTCFSRYISQFGLICVKLRKGCGLWPLFLTVMKCSSRHMKSVL